MGLVKEEQLDFRVNLQSLALYGGRNCYLEGLDLDVLEYWTLCVPCSTDKLKGCRVIATHFTDCFRKVCLEARFEQRLLDSDIKICVIVIL